MRTVFPNREIPHLWAHKTQDNARNAKGSLYFSGDEIFSYGSHFVIARHVTNASGQAAVLINDRSYGVTTSKHVGMVRGAIPSSVPKFHVALGRFSVAELASTVGAWRTEYVKRVNEAIAKMARARSSAEWRHRTAIETRAEALAFCEFFGLNSADLPEVPDLTPEALALYKARERDRDRAAKEAAKVKEAERAAERARALDTWRNGGYAGQGLIHVGPVALRLSADGSEVETSRGVRVPVDAAKLALEVVREVKASGVPWASPPAERVSIGHFSLDKVESDGTLHAGCHVITWGEIERFTASVGW